MNRRGVAYTLVCVILLFVVASIFFAQNRRTGHESHVVVEERVRTMDNFIKNLEQDSQRAAYIAGFRTFIAMEQQVISTGDYFTDSDGTFKEIFLTGNLSGREYNVMLNSSFHQYLDRVVLEAGKNGMILIANITNVTLWQEDPWHILVNYTLDLSLTDTRGTASWDVTRKWTGKVPIFDLRDPLFTVNTLARVQRVIAKTNVSEFIDDTDNLNITTGFQYHFNQSLYYAVGRGPSVLMRFQGNLSDSPYGIESLVNVEELSDQGLVVDSSLTVVDYKYFESINRNICNIQELPSTIKLDYEDMVVYGIDTLPADGEGTLTYGISPIDCS